MSTLKKVDTNLAGKLVIPEGIETIPGDSKSPFRNCTKLTSVYIPSSVLNIEPDSFWNCTSLNEIIVDKKNTVYDSRNNCNAIIKTATNELVQGCLSTVIPYNVTKIGWLAFAAMPIKTIKIPEGVTEIDYAAFFKCEALTNVEFPKTIEVIDIKAFQNCSSLKEVTISNKLKMLGSGAFANCFALSNFNVFGDVETLYGSAFCGCPSLDKISINGRVDQIKDSIHGVETDDVTVRTLSIMGGVSAVEERAFYKWKHLEAADFLKTAKYIGNDAFRECTSLTTVTIPDSVTNIGDRAFMDCGLTSITIGANVSNIGGGAFGGKHLKFITVVSSNSVYDSRSSCNAIIKTSTNELLASCSNTIIPDSVTAIGSYAFYNYPNIASLVIPDSVTAIGSYAFYNKNSILPLGEYIYEGKYYKNGQLSTGLFKNKYYKNGSVSSGVYDGKYYGYDGSLFTGTKTTSIGYSYVPAYYKDGVLFTGIENDKNYVVGIEVKSLAHYQDVDSINIQDTALQQGEFLAIAFVPPETRPYNMRLVGIVTDEHATVLDDLALADLYSTRCLLYAGVKYYFVTGASSFSISKCTIDFGDPVNSVDVGETFEVEIDGSAFTGGYCGPIIFTPTESQIYTLSAETSEFMAGEGDPKDNVVSCIISTNNKIGNFENEVYHRGDSFNLIANTNYYITAFQSKICYSKNSIRIDKNDNFTGILDGKYYLNGELGTGLYNGELYENGSKIENIENIYAGDEFECNFNSLEVGKFKIVAFIPQEGGNYYISQKVDSDSFPVGYLIVSVKTNLKDISLSSEYFTSDCWYNFTAGKIYYIGVAPASPSSQKPDHGSIKISKNSGSDYGSDGSDYGSDGSDYGSDGSDYGSYSLEDETTPIEANTTDWWN